MNNTERYCFVGKIKGLAAQSKRVRKFINRAAAAKKEENVWALVASKRGLGADARHHLLAYGLLRGVPYRSMERNCREDNKPSAQAIRNVLAVHLYSWTLDKKYSLETIQAWLNDPAGAPAVQPKREKRPYVRPAPMPDFEAKASMSFIAKALDAFFGAK